MDNIKKIAPNVYTIEMSSYVKPVLKEQVGRKYVTYDKDGETNGAFQYIIDRSIGSTTNESILTVYNHLLYGRGIVIKGQDEIYEELNDIYPKTEQKKCLADRKKFGFYARQIQKARGGGVAMIKHFPIDKLAMEVADENGVINNVYYSYDWTNKTKYPPKAIPKYNGKLDQKVMIQIVMPYQSGNFYFNDPDYMAALPYCEFEEELANFYLNHIQNGLSPRAVINFNNGTIPTEDRDKYQNLVHSNFTGSNGMPYVISFNDSAETAVTVESLDINDAHSQWEFLANEARQQIITGHGAYPDLFGVPTASGFSSQAELLDTQSKLVNDYQIEPLQMEFLESLKPLLELNGLETDLEFLPLRESYKSTEQTETTVVDDTVDEEEDQEAIEMSAEYDPKNVDLEALLSKGEVIGDEWEIVEDRYCERITLTESGINTVFHFASVPKGDSRKRSEQDTSLFKIRYRYAGNPKPEREFCSKMMLSSLSGKVFRSEDLENAGAVNPGFGPGGSNTYNVFFYKGGPNCKHYFQRVIYLKKGNKKISVNQARKMILQLEPEDRDEARWEQNPSEVAKIPYDMPNNGYLN